MHDNFVDYGKEILLANESQRNKIEFLERERLKRDHFLSDLQENLALNKETLRQYNQFGANSAAVAALNRETELLIGRLKTYYEEYQSINASLLMEQQMRLSDRQLYEERIVEFENKMIDLRKYLHDKEESFTSVVTRLRRYEDLAEPTTEEKLLLFKKEIGERHVNEFITDLIKERNAYQRDCEAMRKPFLAFNEIKNALAHRYEEVAQMLESFEKEHAVKISSLANPKGRAKEEETGKRKAASPNIELIRLIKKEKLNNQLLEDALSDAIEKNEELALANDLFQKNMQQLESKCSFLRAENTLFALRLAEFDQHYCRAAAHRKKYYEEGELQGLRYVTEERVKEYGRAVERFFGSRSDMQRQLSEKMREEVEKWGRHMCEAQGLKEAMVKEGLLVKSSSLPRMVVDFELDDENADNMLIEEF